MVSYVVSHGAPSAMQVDDCIFIDRNPAMFSEILDWLRDGPSDNLPTDRSTCAKLRELNGLLIRVSQRLETTICAFDSVGEILPTRTVGRGWLSRFVADVGLQPSSKMWCLGPMTVRRPCKRE